MIELRMLTVDGFVLHAGHYTEAPVPQVGHFVSLPSHPPQQVVTVVWHFFAARSPMVDVVCSPRPLSTRGYGEAAHDPE